MPSSLTRCFLALVCLLPLTLTAQTITYDDVAVIVNDSSPVSLSIGNYFAQKRGIPTHHIIHVAVPTAETTDSLGFENLRSQIETALNTNNLADSLNYLVTTKGLPLRISRQGGCDSFHVASFIGKCTCVESELPLVLSSNANAILQDNIAPNAYYDVGQHFDRSSYGMFLVSRLDGYTEQDVRDQIDRSGPAQFFFYPDARVLLDYSNTTGGSQTVFQNMQDQAQTGLIPTGLTVVNDNDNSSYVGSDTNLVGYHGVHFMPAQLQLNHHYERGAMAHLLNSSVAFTFDQSMNTNNHYLVADLIADGVGVAAGYTSETFVGPATRVDKLFPYYFDTTQAIPYNAAEAYFLSTPLLSSQNILLGDPKTSVAGGLIMAVPPSDWLDLTVYPNPAQGQFALEGLIAPSRMQIYVRNDLGQLVQEHVQNHPGGPFQIDFDLSQVSPGMYFVQILAGDLRTTKKIIISRN